jgi:hypothetical protein
MDELSIEVTLFFNSSPYIQLIYINSVTQQSNF